MVGLVIGVRELVGGDTVMKDVLAVVVITIVVAAVKVSILL